MSTFDPDLFMNSQTTEANDTTFAPVPVGTYQAAIAKVEPRLANDKPVLEVTWNINDQTARDATGLETPTVRQTIWLDVNASGGLDNGRGKNVGLGKLRAALNQNQAGQPWAPGMLIGQPASIQVTHRNGKEPGQVFAQVGAVTAL
jgi:hypothetical protein